jgi:hypothetical protein
MKNIRILVNRFYSDFLMPSRFGEYEQIIEKALESSYEHITITEFYSKLKTGNLGNKKYFLHRHDIDTDVETAKQFFRIEKKYNVKTTYYFRLKTLDFNFMKEISDFGSEVGYHFEEVADFCKRNKIHTKKRVYENIESISKNFIDNFKSIEERLGRKITSVASHGDFVNRTLQIKNNIITMNSEVREKTGIICEAYDEILINSFDAYISDKPYPVFYYSENIFDAIGKNNVICMLSHPRHWKSNIKVNLRENIERVWQYLFWNI